jgi:multiple sugar transport system permease protein
MAALVALSLQDLSWHAGSAEWAFAGIRHYVELAGDEIFRSGTINTLAFALAAVSSEMVIGLAVALMASRVAAGRVFYRTVFILPILVPAIVIGAMWKLMYNFDFGIVNALAGVIGIAPQDWLGDRRFALLSVIIVDIWHWTPFCYLLLLAAREALPEDIYEAARLDGVGWCTELRFITIPLMMPAIAVTLVFRLISAVKVFDEVFLLTGGGPGTATEVVSYTIYRRFFSEDRVGYGSAMSVVTLVTVMIAVLALVGIGRKRLQK